MTNENNNVYELGFHLVSSLAEEQIEGEFSKIKKLLEKHSASFVSEDFPKLRALAYTMIKKGQGKNVRHDKAYFGWVKFEIATSEIAAIKEALDLNESILRYLITTTVKENTMYTPAVTPREKSEDADAKSDDVVADPELEKSLEEIVVS